MTGQEDTDPHTESRPGIPSAAPATPVRSPR